MRHLFRPILAGLTVTALLATGCSDPDPSAGPDAAETPDAATGPDATVEDLDMRAEDFECILRWEKVRRFRITNRLGHLDQALAVAASPTGGTYPVGTILQLVPMEAMVKRRAGFDAASRDWEFFALEATAQGTTIIKRGTGDVLNQFNNKPCLECHNGAEPKWDLICEQDHGCEPLGISPELIETVQNSDARCP